MVKTLSFKQIAYVIAVCEGLSFDIDAILDVLLGVFQGTRTTAGLPDQMIKEIYDVFKKLKNDPFGAAVDTGTNVAVVYASFKALAFLLKAIGAPQSKTIGGITVRWT